jgi:hypothetical protein
MIDFFGPGFDAAETMGLLPRHRELAYTVNELNYVDRSGRPWAALDYQRMVNSLDGRLISLLRGSAIRELAFGPELNYLRYLGFHTAAYTFSHPELPSSPRRFLLAGSPSGPCTCQVLTACSARG